MSELRDRIAQAWKRGGGPVYVPLSNCRTLAGARRVAAKHTPAEIVAEENGTYTVWGRRDHD